MGFFEQKENSLYFRYNGELVVISPWGENSFRVQSAMQNEIPEGDAVLCKPDKMESDTFEIFIEDSLHASIRNGNIIAELNIFAPTPPVDGGMQITYRNSQGDVLLREISGGGCLGKKSRDYYALSGDSFRLQVSFESNRKEKIYGMGQYQQEIFDLKGCNLELHQRNAQASVPFYISSLGYGFLWQNPAIGAVHFGLNTTEWMAESTKKMDYWITAGNTPAEIEQQYAKCAGTVPMMPEHGLGFWQCKLRYYNQEQVLHVAREYKRRNIPLDVIIIDFYHWFRCGDWCFDKEFFPDPQAMIQELYEMGIETMVSVWPNVDQRSENYEEMKQQGLLVKSDFGMEVQAFYQGNNVFMDPTNPRTRKFVWEKCKKNYADYGIKSFWLDVAEPEYAHYNHNLYRYCAGKVSEVGNLYPREYARLFYEGQKEMGQEKIINLIRCAWAGSQKYGALVWSGDIMSTYEAFRQQICAGLHMGLSGIPWWTTDIGGFYNGSADNPEFVELLLRWFQFGAFCPVMRLHGWRLPQEPIVDQSGEIRQSSGADNEVWSYGEEAYEIMVKFIRIRELMRDYTRSLMEEAHLYGTPVMRTLFYEFPEDETCWDIQDEYMYGGDILVAPVCWEHAFSREVYLPAGSEWIHAGTGQVFAGGTSYTVEAAIDTIPIFLRNGRQDYLVHVV